ncbi:MAG TPA: PQQ-dependent sugar dehydrogenase [Humisphaera sp.]
MNRRHTRSLAACALVFSAVSAAAAAAAPATQPAPREEYRKFAMTHQGDAEAGKRLFAEPGRIACSLCHTTDGTGGKAGPDLFAIGDKFGRDDLIQQVLQPSATIAPGYNTTIVRTKAGDTFEGVVKESGDDAIGLMGSDGQLKRIKAADVEAKRTTDVSLMPEGLEGALTQQQFADLVAYLTTLKAPQSTAAAALGVPSEIQSLKTPVPLRQVNSAANSFKHPVWFGAVPGLTDSFAVVEHETGTIWLYRKTATEESKTPFLKVGKNAPGTTGLIGMTFHPKFTENRKYYIVRHTLDDAGGTGNPSDPKGDGKTAGKTDAKGFATRIFQGVAAADLRSDSGEPLKEVFTIHSTVNDHPGGSLAFGPTDGYLYVGMGDSGPHNDPNGNGQNLSVLQAKIHRIDVDHPDAGKGYSVPKDNPFVNKPGVRPEIWAYGLREPWRFNFDPVTHDLWVGDVGQDFYDEVDIVRRGENYGWNVMEGFERFSNKYRREGETFTPPVFAYARKYGQSVTGGFVYRGDPKSSFYGAYVFGDYQKKKLFALTQKDRKLEKVRLLADAPQSVVSFGQDASGNIYAVGYEGNIYKLDLDATKFE